MLKTVPAPPDISLIWGMLQLNLGPAAQQIVVTGRELDHRRVIGGARAQRTDRLVHFEKQPPLPIVAHHRLKPEERSEERRVGTECRARGWRNNKGTNQE